MNSERIRKLFDVLQQNGLDKHIELPQIAVMGDTSTGKSSLLSAISGIVFPASDKLTTRCPTRLTLTKAETFRGQVHLLRYKTGNIDFATVLKKAEDVTGAIENLTKKLVEEGQSISDDAIVINMQGPDLPNLSLTDLPGLVRTLENKEKDDLITKTYELVKRYMDQPRTVILAVVPANVDVHNSEVLQNATKVDPDGSRTIAVITKPDLVDKGAEEGVRKLLMNERKTLQWGYHMVKLRGQMDINTNLSIKEGLEKEEEFFAKHPVWKSTPPALLGIPKLQVKLVEILQRIVLNALPAVIAEIDTQLKECMTSLEGIGDPYFHPMMPFDL